MERLQRVNQLLKKELSRLLLKEMEFPPDVLTTITRLETTKDLRESNVFVSVFPKEKSEKICLILNKSVYSLQPKLNKRLKMRPLPKIRFLEEKLISEAGRIEEILAELKKK